MNSIDVSDDEDTLDGDDEVTWLESDVGFHDGVTVECLFCEDSFRSSVDVFSHCVNSHQFDMAYLKDKLALDCFSYIRLINYIRKERPTAASVQNSERLYDVLIDDVYLMPVIENDLLLMFDIEDLPASVHPNNKGKECSIDVERLERNRLIQRLKETEHCLKESEQKLSFAIEQITSLKKVALEGLGSDVNSCLMESDNKCQEDVNDCGNSYFSSYSHFSIHHEMLQDEVRTSAYRNAILNNHAIFKGATVLDVGCGTGILSMFAAQSGASLVYGVDQSEIVYSAMDIVRENHLEDTVKLIKGRVEEIHLKDRVDVLISEWMGYFLLFESMLRTVICSRDTHLKEGGLMLPNRTVISIAGISDTDSHSKLVSFWDNVYGFKMSCLKREVVQEANVEIVGRDKIITEPCIVQKLDLTVCTTKDIDFTTSFQLKVLQQGLLTGIVGWFDAHFDLPNMVSLSTSPFSSPTHWKQTLFYLQTPLPVNNGDVIKGRISCSSLPNNPRCFKIQLDFNNGRHVYFLQ